MSTTYDPAPAPATFKKGDRVVYTDGQGARLESTIRRVVVHRGYYDPSKKIRFYALEDARGVLVGGDRLAAA